MANILIFSKNHELASSWIKVLISEHSISIVKDKDSGYIADVVLIEANIMDQDPDLLSNLCRQSTRCLVIGSNLSETKQIELLMRGVAGFYSESEPVELLKKAVECLLKNEAWIHRSLVPKLIIKKSIY